MDHRSRRGVDEVRRRRLAAAPGPSLAVLQLYRCGCVLVSCLVQDVAERGSSEHVLIAQASTYPSCRGVQCRKRGWLAAAAYLPARQCTAVLATVLAAGWLPLQTGTVQSALLPICLSGVTKFPLVSRAEGLQGWCLRCALHVWRGVGCTETKQLKEGEQQEGLEKSACQDERGRSCRGRCGANCCQRTREHRAAAAGRQLRCRRRLAGSPPDAAAHAAFM
jgi:hypothetical protein